MIYLSLLLGCLLLYKGGDWLLDGMTEAGSQLGWPKAVTGLVLVSLGTSAPELFVSVGSAIQDHGAMAAGNVIGSNIINTAVVLGIAASVTVLFVERVLQHQLLAMMAISIAVVVMLVDGELSRIEGFVLLLIMLGSFGLAFVSSSSGAQTGLSQATTQQGAKRRSALLIVIGILALLVGAEALIWGGLELAERFMVSETVVALTVTALGTSLPEIAATVVAVVRRETSLAVGNVIGSNLLNIGLVLGVSAMIVPLQQIEIGSLTAGCFLGLALFMVAAGFKPAYYPRWAGVGLMLSYVAYVSALVVT